jgi:hypothetical protein
MGKGYKKRRNKVVKPHKPRPDAIDGKNFVNKILNLGNLKMEYVFGAKATD